ncbi:MAG: thioredoxin family protein [Xenococcaceae cyanobacterium MO_207.B15]|nr:thioredoxin family protein [Xenococcaceae cyanobacterium MO_207.B15]MDJ0745156.1 thioredoxin family protein [Xenococcaceae cyanobacterium MO_167.B27]
MSIKHQAEYIREKNLKQLMQNENLVVVYYLGTLCGCFDLIISFMDRLAEEYQGKAKIVKIDIEQNSNNAKKNHISNLPRVLIFKDAKLTEQFVGKSPYETYSNAVEMHLQL